MTSRINRFSKKVIFRFKSAIVPLLFVRHAMYKHRMRLLTPEEVLFKSQDPLIFEVRACYENFCEYMSFYSKEEAKKTIEVFKTNGIKYTVYVRLPSNNAIKLYGIEMFD